VFGIGIPDPLFAVLAGILAKSAIITTVVLWLNCRKKSTNFPQTIKTPQKAVRRATMPLERAKR
jgi:hypothetical protein